MMLFSILYFSSFVNVSYNLLTLDKLPSPVISFSKLSSGGKTYFFFLLLGVSFLAGGLTACCFILVLLGVGEGTGEGFLFLSTLLNSVGISLSEDVPTDER